MQPTAGYLCVISSHQPGGQLALKQFC